MNDVSRVKEFNCAQKVINDLYRMSLGNFGRSCQVQELFEISLHVLHYYEVAHAKLTAVLFLWVKQVNQFRYEIVLRYC